MAKSFFLSQASTFCTVNTTEYFSLEGDLDNGHTTEVNKETRIRDDGEINNLKAYSISNANTGTSTITVRLNLAVTDISVTYTSGQTGLKEDTADGIGVSTSDEVSYEVATGATGGSLTLSLITTTFIAQVDENAYSIFGSASCSIATQNVTYRIVADEAPGFSNNEEYNIIETYIASNMSVYVRGNSRVLSSTSFGFWKNGATTSMSVSFSAGETGFKEDTTDTNTVAANDNCAHYTTTGTGASGTVSCEQLYTKFLSNTETNKYCVKVAYNNTQVSVGSTTVYFALVGQPETSVTENNFKFPLSFDCTMTDLQTLVHTAAATFQIVVRLDGVDTALSVSFSANGYYSDTDTVSVSAGQYISIQCSRIAGTSTADITGISLAFYTEAMYTPQIIWLND